MMTETEIEDAVWLRVAELLPPCDACQGPQAAGGVSGRHVLVCSACSQVSEVDADAIAQVVTQARADVANRNAGYPHSSALLPAVSLMRQTGVLAGEHEEAVLADRDVGAELISLVRRLQEVGWDGTMLAHDFLEQVLTGKVPARRLMMEDVVCPSCDTPLTIDQARVVVTDSELQVSNAIVLMGRRGRRS